MTMGELIARIDNIPATEHYTDKAGNFIGKALTRWIDIKPLVMKILKEYEESEVEPDE